MNLCPKCRRFSGLETCSVCHRPTILFVPYKLSKEILKAMRIQQDDSGVVLLKEFHKQLCRKLGWRCIKHIWHVAEGHYVLGLRDNDGAAELLACLHGQPGKIVHTGSLMDADDQAMVQTIINQPVNQWVDPEAWHIYKATYLGNDNWLYWLRNDEAESKSKPYQVVERQGAGLTAVASFLTKKEAGTEYNRKVKNGKKTD